MPRRLAFDVLRKSEQNSTYSNIAIDAALKNSTLSAADRALASIITLGVTERRLTLDYYIDALADDPSKIDADTRTILRIGIYQLLYLTKIPAYAAVNEAVNMAKRSSRGFVNAIMRSFLRKKDSIKFPEDEIKNMSLTYSYPEEICELFLSIYGRERAERVLDFFNKPPKMTLRVNTLKVSVDDYQRILADRGIESERSPYAHDALIIGGMDFHAIPYSDEGYFFVQDVASQICVETTGATSGEFIIDTCSCPGSKSFGMAIRMKNNGRIISCDLHKSKLSLVEKGAERLSIDIIETREIDGRKTVDEWLGRADRVLCDVPCSGLGVIGKKPEIRYKKLGDIRNLPAIQLDILRNASKYVKVGGMLIYSTCTVIPEENELNVKRFLSEHPEFEVCDFSIGEERSQNGYITLHPDIHGTDGFFVCRMMKKG